MQLTKDRINEICSKPDDSYNKGAVLLPSHIADDLEVDEAFFMLQRQYAPTTGALTDQIKL